jgi:hypothetical protein
LLLLGGDYAGRAKKAGKYCTHNGAAASQKAARKEKPNGEDKQMR